MTGYLKVLGLTIAAVLSMGALWAASAQAADPELHCTSTTNTCTVTWNERNTHTLTLEGGNVRCRSKMHATLNAKTVSSLSGVTAEYTGCRVYGVAGEVRMEGCTYTFNLIAASSPATSNGDLVCPAGKTIVISVPALPCTITIGAQNLPHVVFSNGGGAEPTDVVANFTVSGINYNTSGSCLGRNGNRNGGTYNGESTLEGFNDNGPNSAEGNKVGLHVKPL